MQGREDALMRSFYPDRAGKLRDLVEEECGLLDYEGSRIYDEFPDRSMVRRMSGEILRRIGKEFPEEYRNADFLQEMTDVFSARRYTAEDAAEKIQRILRNDNNRRVLGRTDK